MTEQYSFKVAKQIGRDIADRTLDSGSVVIDPPLLISSNEEAARLGYLQRLLERVWEKLDEQTWQVFGSIEKEWVTVLQKPEDIAYVRDAIRVRYLMEANSLLHTKFDEHVRMREERDADLVQALVQMPALMIPVFRRLPYVY